MSSSRQLHQKQAWVHSAAAAKQPSALPLTKIMHPLKWLGTQAGAALDAVLALLVKDIAAPEAQCTITVVTSNTAAAPRLAACLQVTWLIVNASLSMSQTSGCAIEQADMHTLLLIAMHCS